MGMYKKYRKYRLPLIKERYSIAPLRKILDTLQDGIIIIENDIIVECNKAVLDIFEYTEKNKFIGLSVSKAIQQLQYESKLSCLKLQQGRKEFVNRDEYNFQWSFQMKNGYTIEFEVTMLSIKDKRKEMICIILQDISDYLEMERLITKEENKYKELFERSNAIILLIDPLTSCITDANSAACKFYGYSREQLRNMKIEDINMLPPEVIFENINLVLNNDREHFYFKHYLASGEIRDVEVYCCFVETSKKKILFSIIHDITERNRAIQALKESQIVELKKLEAKIEYLAYRDSLTDLYNRAYFMEKLNQEVISKNITEQKMVVMFMDIDNFKKLNDTLGHSIGDKALICFGNRIKEIIKDRGIIFRIGGDEFSILLHENATMEEALNISNEIIKSFDIQAQVDSHYLYITSSIGISVFPKDGKDPETLIRNADIAMYEAKKQGTCKVQLYSEDIHNQIREEFLIDNYLRNSLLDDEFYLEFQPIIKTDTEKVVGAEALIRWKHPELGVISPDKFIKVAEKNRTILELGRWVFKHVCKQIKRMSEKGIKQVFVSSNVSVIQLEHENFYEFVKMTLDEYNISPGSIILEVTESSLMENLSKVREEIGKIRTLGIGVAIDDFGTGYSSLGQIKKLDISELKIDKIFINDIGDKETNSIVSAIISISKSLNMKVIAEGVETKQQLEFLNTLNCDMLQGYYFSKPVSKDKLEQIFISGLYTTEL